MQIFTDSKGRKWELTPVAVHDKYAGGKITGFLCWVKSAAKNSHPGDYARTNYGLNGFPIVAPTDKDAIDAGEAFAEGHP